MTESFLYLSEADIAALAIETGVVIDAVARVFRDKSSGRAFSMPKVKLGMGPDATIQAMLGATADPALSAVKLVGVNAQNPGRGLPLINALVVLTDATTGRVQAVMNGNWITAIRTAACSAIAARALARTDSETVGFVGCGLQARMHLHALRHVLPGLRQACLLGRTPGPVQRLAAEAQALGMDVVLAGPAEAAIAGMDVVVTSVPGSTEPAPFLDPRWISAGAFVSAVDVGRSWIGAGWRESFDVIATDDRPQSHELGGTGYMVYGGPFDAELGELVLATHPGRTRRSERTSLIFAGIALADLSVAALVADIARRRGTGHLLPL